ncbi:hypothetical protein ACET3Z_020881 [Daucus carota]
MKIVHKDISPNGPGSVKMVPEEADDLWLAYNLISKGDKVMAATVRKVLRETASGGRDSERLKLTLEIKAEDVDYDKEGSLLRIRGKSIVENAHVKIGAFHTLELELHRPFVLRKVCFSLVIAIYDAKPVLHICDPSASADLAVVMMQEGLAQIFLIGKSVTVMRSRIEASIPRKHGPAIAGYDKALDKFFVNVAQAFLKHIDFQVVRCAVIASSGFTKDQFHRHLMLEAERKQLRTIIENKSRIILVHTTSGYKHNLREVLDAPNVMNMIKDTKAAQEARALKDFFAMLSNDAYRACYGPKHVEVAHERMAVQTLLITDELFRNSDVGTRKKYVSLVDSVKNSGGAAHIFSSMHASGEHKIGTDNWNRSNPSISIMPCLSAKCHLKSKNRRQTPCLHFGLLAHLLSLAPLLSCHYSVSAENSKWSGDSSSILPSDPYDRVVARFWAAYFDDKVVPVQRAKGWR